MCENISANTHYTPRPRLTAGRIQCHQCIWRYRMVRYWRHYKNIQKHEGETPWTPTPRNYHYKANISELSQSLKAKLSCRSPSIPEIWLYVSVSFLRTFPVKWFQGSRDQQLRYTLYHSAGRPGPSNSAVLLQELDTRLSEYTSRPTEDEETL